MENVKNKYETIFVIDASLAEDQINATTEKFKALIEANATLEACEPFGANGGVRTLAYEIEDQTQGAYILMTYAAKPELPAEIERIAGITEGVLRVLTIRK